MKLTIYRTLFRREWRWRLKGGNNKIIAASSEGFRNRVDCVNNIKLTYVGLMEEQFNIQ